MAYDLPDLSQLGELPFDTIIDVRSPAEFAEDHIPGAINLPALDNEERARVGTIYVQESPFKARKIGAALVARNVARHLDGPLSEMEGGWMPLVYCWRGGQRSGSVASILSQIGWRAETLLGGYQSYRRAVVAGLYDEPLRYRLVVLDGLTGTAKTELIHRVAALGVQVIDLEGLANHRGSVLGPCSGGQPAQKGFETALASALFAHDPTRPVLVEAESSKVGELLLPPSLWKAMCAAPRLRVEAPAQERARYLARVYADLSDDPAALKQLLDKLIPLCGRAEVEAWHGLIDEGAFEALAQALITGHYDQRYRKAGRADPEETLAISLDPAGLDKAANQIIDRLDKF